MRDGNGRLRAALGRYPHTDGLYTGVLPAAAMLALDEVTVISRAFKPMVREGRYDVNEMAVATLLMARAAGSDLVLLPVVMAARAQTGALLRQAGAGFGAGALGGKRVGARAYSQTTGLWLRGALAEEHGLRAQDMRWVVFEEAHVAGFEDPPWCERAAAGSDMAAMLRGGALDAAVFGNEVPDDPALAPVYADAAGAGAGFRARHGFDPVNHMVVVRAAVAQVPGMVRRLLALLAAGNPYPHGRRALDPVLRLAAEYGLAQGLLRRPLSLDEIWAGLPAGCEEL